MPFCLAVKTQRWGFMTKSIYEPLFLTIGINCLTYSSYLKRTIAAIVYYNSMQYGRHKNIKLYIKNLIYG